MELRRFRGISEGSGRRQALRIRVGAGADLLRTPPEGVLRAAPLQGVVSLPLVLVVSLGELPPERLVQSTAGEDVVDGVLPPLVRPRRDGRGVGVELRGGVVGRVVVVAEVRRLGGEVRVDLGLHLLQRVPAALVEARLPHQARAAEPLRLGDHGGVDAVAEGPAVLAGVVGNVLVLLLVYVAHIVEGVALALGLQVGNALHCEHHVGEELVQLAVLVLGSEGGRLGGQGGAGGGVGVGVLLVTCENVTVFALPYAARMLRDALSGRSRRICFLKVSGCLSFGLLELECIFDNSTYYGFTTK